MSVILLRERAAQEALPLAIVAAESLHVLLLDALFAHPESRAMAFQGGTCLHLVHGGYSYSEHLDLAGRDLDAETSAQSQLGGEGYRLIRERAREVLDGAARAVGLA